MRTHVSGTPRIYLHLFLSAVSGLTISPAFLFAQKPTAAESQASQPTATRTKFDLLGPQVRDELPDLRLLTMKGEVQRLSDAWQTGPALLITSSLTCPKSRSRWPELKAIADKYSDQKLNVVILYVIEAHPVGSICPYKDVEDITPENERDGILRRQPATLEDRLELAQEFKRLLRIGVPIYVDNLKNETWNALGAAPNLALLVDREGQVVARQGWFEGKTLEKLLGEKLVLLTKKDAYEERDRDRSDAKEIDEIPWYEIRNFIRDEKEVESLARLLSKHPSLLKYVFPVTERHHEETTILMEAVEYGNRSAVKLLLERGADVHAATGSFRSALQLAAQKGDLEIVKLLLKHKANPAVPKTGKSPLHQALMNGHREVAETLLAAGASADFYSDIALGNEAAVRKLLAADSSWALRPDGAQRMPLDYAAANGQTAIAAILLAHGAPVVKDKHVRQAPPLHYAIRQKDAAMVELLLKAGSSPDTTVMLGEDYKTPALHLAISSKNIAILKLLLAYKADLKVRNTYSYTALHQAVEEDQAETVSLLIKAGAVVNAPQLGFSLPCGSLDDSIPTQNTPLHFAATHGTPAAIKALIAGGAKLEARNRFGQTPLLATVSSPRHYGRADPKIENIRTLLAAGADINAADEEGQTALDLVTTARSELDKEEDPAAKQGETLSELTALLRKLGAKAGVRKVKPADKDRLEDDPFGI